MVREYFQNLTKKKYKQAESKISKLLSRENDDTYKFVILKSLESYNYSFLYKKIAKKEGIFFYKCPSFYKGELKKGKANV